MAHSKQAKKRIRQNEKNRIRNKSVRSEIKTLTKAFSEKVKAEDTEGARALLSKVTSKLDKAAKTRVYHKNAVARRKSKLARQVQEPPAAEPAGSA